MSYANIAWLLLALLTIIVAWDLARGARRQRKANYDDYVLRKRESAAVDKTTNNEEY